MKHPNFDMRPPQMPDISGDEVVRIRESMGLSQEELANLLGTITSTVSRWERRDREPRRSSQVVLKLMSDRIKRGNLRPLRADRFSGEEIKKLRAAVNMSMQNFARAIGSTTNSVYRWEHGTEPRPISRTLLTLLKEKAVAAGLLS